jgi:hypothetical protein
MSGGKRRQLRRLAQAAIVAIALGQITCHQVILTAPPGSEIQLFANPEFIVAHTGVSVISAIVIEPVGTPVPDGTVVQFFTTLGQIDEQGKTNDGVARVNLVADSRSGTASVTAYSGAASATLDPGVAIGSALPARLLVVADPPRITESRSTHVFANVFDDVGNPVANVPVIFTVTADPATEFMDNAGRQIFTDSSGRAEDVMRTQRTTSGTATVKATVPASAGFIEGEVSIPIVR